MTRVSKNRKNKRKRYLWVITTLIGGVIGVTYSLLVGGNPKVAFPTGCAITGGVFGFELMFVQHAAGTWLRRLPLLIFILISSVFGQSSLHCVYKSFLDF